MALPCVDARQTSNANAFDFGGLVLERFVIIPFASDHIGVHTGPTDLFADLIQQQDIDLGKRQLGHPAFGHRQEFGFARLELFGRNRFDPSRLVVGVLENGKSPADTTLIEDFSSHTADNLIKTVIDDRSVVDLRPFVFAKPDEHHLHQPAFDGAGEPSVCLNASRDEDVVGFVGMPIKVDRKPFGRFGNDHRFHAGSDLTAAKLGRDLVTPQNLELAFGRTATVTAHRGDDERLRPQLPQVLDQRFENQRNVADPTTARSDGHRFTGPDSLVELQPFQRGLRRLNNVGNNRSVEMLVDAKESGPSGHPSPFFRKNNPGRYSTRIHQTLELSASLSF